MTAATLNAAQPQKTFRQRMKGNWGAEICVTIIFSLFYFSFLYPSTRLVIKDGDERLNVVALLVASCVVLTIWIILSQIFRTESLLYWGGMLAAVAITMLNAYAMITFWEPPDIVFCRKGLYAQAKNENYAQMSDESLAKVIVHCVETRRALRAEKALERDIKREQWARVSHASQQAGERLKSRGVNTMTELSEKEKALARKLGKGD